MRVRCDVGAEVWGSPLCLYQTTMSLVEVGFVALNWHVNAPEEHKSEISLGVDVMSLSAWGFIHSGKVQRSAFFVKNTRKSLSLVLHQRYLLKSRRYKLVKRPISLGTDVILFWSTAVIPIQVPRWVSFIKITRQPHIFCEWVSKDTWEIIADIDSAALTSVNFLQICQKANLTR